MQIQESGEMYLETILILSKKNGNTVRSIDIAKHTGYSKPSVSRAIHILKEGGLLNMDSEGIITLTDEGSEIANNIYERHIYITEFFTKIGVSEDVAAEDACRIEHCISQETFNKIKEYLANNLK